MSTQRPFICTCGKAYARGQHLRRHQSSCSRHLDASLPGLTENECGGDGVRSPPKKSYFCSDCQAGPFRQKKMVWAHVAMVHRERRHVCEQCSKAFPTKSRLIRHSTKHHGFTCSYCVSLSTGTDISASHIEPLTKFDSFVALRRHVALVHPKPILQCSKCNRRFNRPSALAEHERTHTPGGPEARRRFVCPFCPVAADCLVQTSGSDSLPPGAVAFTERRNLHAHLRSVHANIAYPCTWPGCPVLLSTNQKLNEHLQRHSTNRPVAKTTRERHRKRYGSGEKQKRNRVPYRRDSSKQVDEDFETASQSSVVALILDSDEDLSAQNSIFPGRS